MLKFSTKLIVNEKLTKEVFTEFVVRWLSNNPNYNFGRIKVDNKLELCIQNKSESVEISNFEETLTVHLVARNKGIIWTNDYVLTCIDDKKVLAIQLYSDATNLSVKLPETFHKPRLLRQIVQEGYGGMDNDLPVSDYPYMICEDNIDVACRLIMHESMYFMPVIYVSYPRYDIDKPIDFATMSKNLSGIAHVVVEMKDIASRVRKATNEHNPYAGAVEIFYGRNSSYRVLPDNFESLDIMRKFIENSVQQKILMTRIEDEFSLMKIHFNYLQLQNKETPELINIYEQLLKEAEEEGELKKQHIDDLEHQIKGLEEKCKDMNAELMKKESQIQTYQSYFNKAEENSLKTINITATENELYADELKDVILKILEKERGEMDQDSNLISSRKFHVLDNILKLNEQTGKASQIANCLRGIVDKSCNLNAQKKRQLIELGFEIKIGTHYKIIFNQDERYAFTLSKTASDFRSNTNTLKDAINMLFGR